MKMSKTRLSSLVALCAAICLAVFALVQLHANPAGAAPRLAYVFLIEPWFTEVSAANAAGSMTAGVVFLTWLIIAGLVVKSRSDCRRFRTGFLVALPALAICAFNAVFDAGCNVPGVAPAAMVALIGTLIYELAFARNWSRLCMVMVTFILCAAYGAHTSLGPWGTLVSACTMGAVQLVWSGIEMSALDLTFGMQNRKFGYR